MTGKRDEKRRVTRQKLIETARTLFDKRGFDGTGMRAVASQAGVSTGAIFANFASKEDLWSAVYGRDYVPPAVEIEQIKAKVRTVIKEMRDCGLAAPAQWADRLEGAIA